MYWSTLWPGSCPPSPGFAPCAILICSSSAFTRYSLLTPNRPEATCLMALFLESPRSLFKVETHEPTKRAYPSRLIVDQLAEFLERLIVVASASVLQLVYRLRVE